MDGARSEVVVGIPAQVVEGQIEGIVGHPEGNGIDGRSIAIQLEVVAGIDIAPSGSSARTMRRSHVVDVGAPLPVAAGVRAQPNHHVAAPNGGHVDAGCAPAIIRGAVEGPKEHRDAEAIAGHGIDKQGTRLGGVRRSPVLVVEIQRLRRGGDEERRGIRGNVVVAEIEIGATDAIRGLHPGQATVGDSPLGHLDVKAKAIDASAPVPIGIRVGLQTQLDGLTLELGQVELSRLPAVVAAAVHRPNLRLDGKVGAAQHIDVEGPLYSEIAGRPNVVAEAQTLDVTG